MIAKDLMIAKDFYTYSSKILRQEKSIRDHRRGGIPSRAIARPSGPAGSPPGPRR
jgi:hypothetical protein